MTTTAPPSRPMMVPVDPAGIHPELIEHDAWVVWRLEPKPKKPGKWTKVPYRATDPRRKALSTDPSTWSTFDVAFMAYQADDTLDGIGSSCTTPGSSASIWTSASPKTAA